MKIPNELLTISPCWCAVVAHMAGGREQLLSYSTSLERAGWVLSAPGLAGALG